MAVRVTSGPYKVSDERKKRKTHSNTFKTNCANIAGRTELLSERLRVERLSAKWGALLFYFLVYFELFRRRIRFKPLGTGLGSHALPFSVGTRGTSGNENFYSLNRVKMCGVCLLRRIFFV